MCWSMLGNVHQANYNCHEMNEVPPHYRCRLSYFWRSSVYAISYYLCRKKEHYGEVISDLRDTNKNLTFHLHARGRPHIACVGIRLPIAGADGIIECETCPQTIDVDGGTAAHWRDMSNIVMYASSTSERKEWNVMVNFSLICDIICVVGSYVYFSFN